VGHRLAIGRQTQNPSFGKGASVSGTGFRPLPAIWLKAVQLITGTGDKIGMQVVIQWAPGTQIDLARASRSSLSSFSP